MVIFLELYIGDQFHIQFLFACIYILFIVIFLNASSFVCFLLINAVVMHS